MCVLSLENLLQNLIHPCSTYYKNGKNKNVCHLKEKNLFESYNSNKKEGNFLFKKEQPVLLYIFCRIVKYTNAERENVQPYHCNS